jgi:hypothetical protein
MEGKITIDQIQQAQQAWAQGLIKISEKAQKNQDFITQAKAFVNEHYAYEQPGGVLFKPTRAANPAFRTDFEGALAYFIGNNQRYCSDQGFALFPWVQVHFENHALQQHQELTIVIGSCIFQQKNAIQTVAEYTMGYKKINEQFKLVLHHSSLPFTANAK